MIWRGEGPNATVQGSSQGATGCGESTQHEARAQPFALSQLQAPPPHPVFFAPKDGKNLPLSLSLTQVALRAGRIIPTQPLRSTSPAAMAGHQHVTQDLALLALLQ